MIIAVVAFLLWFPVDSWNQTALFGKQLILGDDFQKYVNRKYGFSLEYPRGWSVENFDEQDGAETIVFSGGDQSGFQVFIAPFYGDADEIPKFQRLDDLLTEERILRDLPSAVIDDSLEILIGPNRDQRALLFWSDDPTIGRTREVWLVHNGYLYEITGYPQIDELLAGIMHTWTFEE